MAACVHTKTMNKHWSFYKKPPRWEVFVVKEKVVLVLFAIWNCNPQNNKDLLENCLQFIGATLSENFSINRK